LVEKSGVSVAKPVRQMEMMSQGSMEEEKVPLVQNLFPNDEHIHVSESEKVHRDGLMQKLQ
jgi:hypothetical protein